jgi:hypothetical protein
MLDQPFSCGEAALFYAFTCGGTYGGVIEEKSYKGLRATMPKIFI